MKDINIMSLDLEYNQPSKTIIQVGIAIGNLKSGEILAKQCYNIKVEEQISEFIIELTGITQEDVDNGITLDEAYKYLIKAHTDFNCFRNALTWGGGDSDDLRKALGLDDDRYLFGRRWIDAKTLFVSKCMAMDAKTQSGLAKSMVRLGLKFEGTKHNAMDDATNTFYIYRKLLEELK